MSTISITRKSTFRIAKTCQDFSEGTSKVAAINLALAIAPGQHTVREIAALTKCSPQRVTDHLRSLASRNQIEVYEEAQDTSERDPAEDAIYYKQLLAEARKEFAEVRKGYVTTVSELTAQVDALRQQAKDAQSQFKTLRLEFDGRTVEVEGDLVHEKFPQVLQLAQARMNIFLYGPTGCGKSHICSQIAEVLELPFYSISCTSGMSESVMSGKLLPVGEAGKFDYLPSEFILAYEEGGVFLMDEMDAADPNVLLLLNSALANGYINLPARVDKPRAKKHKDFVMVAAANTLGNGADRMYSGRNQLDGATLDRFAIGKVHMTYDARLEAQLCPNEELRAELLRIREGINEYRLERAMSTRFMKDANKMLTVGWTINQILEAYFMGWRADEVAKVRR